MRPLCCEGEPERTFDLATYQPAQARLIFGCGRPHRWNTNWTPLARSTKSLPPILAARSTRKQHNTKTNIIVDVAGRVPVAVGGAIVIDVAPRAATHHPKCRVPIPPSRRDFTNSIATDEKGEISIVLRCKDKFQNTVSVFVPEARRSLAGGEAKRNHRKL